MGKFRHLDVPRQWTETFTKYPHGLTIFEALVDWTSQVDKMVDNVNDWNDYLDDFVDNFEFELQEEVKATINKWQSEGLLDGIIESALDTELDNVKLDIVQVQNDLVQTAQELNDVVKHRPIHVGENEPSNEIGQNGDLYLQTYKENELIFYEEGTFELTCHDGDGEIDGMEYVSRQGYFTRIGNVVNVSINLELSNPGNTRFSTLRISGLPYLPSIIQTVPSGEHRGLDLGEDYLITGYLISTDGRFTIRRENTIDGITDISNAPSTALQNNFRMIANFSYRI